MMRDADGMKRQGNSRRCEGEDEVGREPIMRAETSTRWTPADTPLSENLCSYMATTSPRRAIELPSGKHSVARYG
jgi:hypothetical protein